MRHFARALFLAGSLGMGGFASAATLHVANNGLDTNSCGAADPCRSISRAIAAAAAGDIVLVGPGRYGELDQSGGLGGVGEEGGAAGYGVLINKPLTLLSTAGAGATLIDLAGTVDNAVTILSSDVKFGDRNTGFTITGGRNFGLMTENVTNVVINGNTASKAPFAGFLVRSAGQVEMRGNTAVGNPGTGFWVIASNPNDTFLFTGNTARDNQTGISVSGPGSHRVTHNDVLGNENGLLITYGNSRIAHNYVAGNRWGAMLNGYSPDFPLTRGPQIVRNSFVGNRANGLDILPGQPGLVIAVRENNFYGNGNCGLTNQTSLGGNTPVNVDARRNYWGAATGPSFIDPADEACPGLSTIQTSPFATSEFPIR